MKNFEGRKADAVLPQLVSLAELAEAWSCDRTTARRILSRAGVRAVIFTPAKNGMLRFALRDVEALLQQCTGKEDEGLV